MSAGEVMSLPEGWFKCPFCSCMFVTESDFQRHLDFWSRTPETHRARVHDEMIRRNHYRD